MRWKMEQYRRNGVKLVSLYPTELSSLCTDSGLLESPGHLTSND